MTLTDGTPCKLSAVIVTPYNCTTESLKPSNWALAVIGNNILISGNDVSFTVVLTTPACPLKDMIKNACINAVKLLVNKEARVTVNFTSNTSTNRKDSKAVLSGVKNIIAVVSGKGGVGKSTVASNLALALSEGGAKVGLIDGDIYGPSVHIMFGVRGERPMMKEVDGKGMIVPLERYGIKVMSIGLLVDEKQAVVWRGPMVSSAIKQFVSDVDWGELDYLVIDMPPGTGDIHLTVVQTVPVTGVIVVTTPQTVALADAKKGIAMFGQAQLKVPIIGLVENMSYFTPAELPNNKYYLFGKDGGKHLAEEFDIPFLGQIPLVQSIREGGDLGIPVMADSSDELVKKAFADFASKAVRGIAMRNANMEPTEIQAIVE
ncbi:MAG: Mrp/NBP35 family ATP-binding protein [Sphingobacteriales bacterium]|nr:Mrp/NBP35 family ATP-binding protein [Sphingobacteriales bacterium]